jgi:hypothetical protein
MYILPLVVIVLIALAIFFSPILAVILFVICLIGLGLYKFLGRGDESQPTPSAQAKANEEETGMWGERRPS